MPWQIFKPEKIIPDTRLKGVISIRKDGVGIAGDLVDAYLGADSRLEILMNFETGEIALRPGVVGYALRKREGKLSYNFRAVNFLRAHLIERGLYPARWDGEKLVFKVWEPKPSAPPILEIVAAPESKAEPKAGTEEEPSSSVDGSVCPVCQKGILHNGACDNCGWDEAEGIECPNGLARPFEKMEVCKGCNDYKRVYGDSPRKCRWNGWLNHE